MTCGALTSLRLHGHTFPFTGFCCRGGGGGVLVSLILVPGGDAGLRLPWRRLLWRRLPQVPLWPAVFLRVLGRRDLGVGSILFGRGVCSGEFLSAGLWRGCVCSGVFRLGCGLVVLFGVSVLTWSLTTGEPGVRMGPPLLWGWGSGGRLMFITCILICELFTLKKTNCVKSYRLSLRLS